MYCPVCKDKRLTTSQLEEHLKAGHCSGCDGHWLARSNYENWTAHHTSEATPYEHVKLDTQDVAHAKLCPECSRIMGRFKVGRGADFYVDRCSCCGGVWLDQHEWLALKKHDLHTQVERIFTTQRERETREADVAERLDAIYRDRFGTEVYAELKRVRGWLQEHPASDQLFAYLRDEDPYRV